MVKYIFLTTIIFMLSLAALFIIITYVDPFGYQRILGFITFFAALFLAVSSFFTFILFFAKELFSNVDLSAEDYLIAVRRGGLVGFLVIGLTAMHLVRILTLFEAILLVIFLVLLEMSFMTNKH